VSLSPADLADVGEELAAYHAHFAPRFARREQRAWAAVYLRGLLIADVPRKNVEAMALRLCWARVLRPRVRCGPGSSSSARGRGRIP
jgi:hypothetical protein